MSGLHSAYPVYGHVPKLLLIGLPLVDAKKLLWKEHIGQF